MNNLLHIPTQNMYNMHKLLHTPYSKYVLYIAH